MAAPRRLAKILLGLAVSAGLLVYLFRDVDLRDVGRRIIDTHWGLLAASIALNLVALWTRSRRWRYLFPPGSGVSHLLAGVVIGYTGNNLLPLRAGEALRAYVIARRGQRIWTTVATIVVERVLDGLAVGLILLYLLVWVSIPRELGWGVAVFLGAEAVLLTLVAFMAGAPDLTRRLVHAVLVRPAGLARRVSRVLDTFNEGLRGIRTPRHAVPIVAWSVANWMLWALSMWAALHATRLPLPFIAAWTVLAFVALGVSLPSSPGFAGVVQAAVVLALALFGIPRAEALSVSLVYHAAQFIPVTAWGLVLMVGEQMSLAEASRATRETPPSS